jgi:uncharacterized phage protein gp47/JayE
MPIDIPTLDELHQRLLDAAKGSLTDLDIARFSDEYKRLRVVAGMGFQLNHHLSVIADDVLADTAEGDQQDRHGFIYNVTRKPATPAAKADALRLVGASGSPFVVGDELVSVGGLRFQVNEGGTIPAAGQLDVDVVGIDTGSQTKLNAGEVLTFLSAPVGIEAEAELQLDLDEGGDDQESDGAYRVRILNAIQQPGMGGNANDYEQFAIEEEGIATAYVYPLRGGAGTVDVAALHTGSGTVRLLTTGEIATLQTAMDVKIPVSLKTGTSFRVLEVTSLEQDVEITVEPTFEAQFQFDWDDSGGALALDGATPWTGATRTLKLDLDRPTDMDEGDRIVIKTAAGDGTGEVFTIERFGAATDEIILDKSPVPAPVAADLVYAGGPLTNAVRDSILEFIDALGPAIGDDGVGNWFDSIIPSRMEAIALDEDGVNNATTVTPVSTVTPADPQFPLDGTIELLIPGEILVRKT